MYMQSICRWPGLRGMPRGSIRSLRVVALEYRHFPIGSLRLNGPGGGSACSTPIALRNGSYDSAGKPAEKPFQVGDFGPNPLVNWMNGGG